MPSGRHDDQADALSQLMSRVLRAQSADTPSAGGMVIWVNDDGQVHVERDGVTSQDWSDRPVSFDEGIDLF